MHAVTPGWIVLATALLSGCAHDSTPHTPPAQSPAAHATQSAQPTASAATQAFLDPVTGQWRAPTQAELEALNPARKQAQAASSRSTITTQSLPGGVTEYNLGQRARAQDTVCLNAQGALVECTAAQRAALGASSSVP